MIAALLNALGPGLCCCAMMSLLPQSHAEFGSVVELPPEPSCPHCVNEQLPLDDNESPLKSPTKSPTKHKCPCQDRETLAIQTTASEVELVTFADLFANTLASPFDSATMPVAVRSRSPIASQPFWRAEVRQRQHHVLHC